MQPREGARRGASCGSEVRVDGPHRLLRAARVRKGEAQYGEPLTTHNGRDALLDAYEEAMDLALYLKKALMERAKR